MTLYPTASLRPPLKIHTPIQHCKSINKVLPKFAGLAHTPSVFPSNHFVCKQTPLVGLAERYGVLAGAALFPSFVVKVVASLYA
jgi:hypothetical protein